MALAPLKFDTNGLYLLLSDLGDGYRFHWGLYLAKSGDSGTIFHITNSDDDAKAWVYEAKESGNVGKSQRLLIGLKIAVMDPALHESLQGRLQQVPIAYSSRFKEEITCRVWAKEALFELDSEGYISLTVPVEDIEEEAKSVAMLNRHRRARSIVKSQGSIA